MRNVGNIWRRDFRRRPPEGFQATFYLSFQKRIWEGGNGSGEVTRQAQGPAPRLHACPNGRTSLPPEPRFPLSSGSLYAFYSKNDFLVKAQLASLAIAGAGYYITQKAVHCALESGAGQ